MVLNVEVPVRVFDGNTFVDNLTIDYFFKHVFFPGDSLVFKRAIEASEQYYLLYYMPKNYRKDGKFKKIKVRVKNKKFSVSHRAGYFAN